MPHVQEPGTLIYVVSRSTDDPNVTLMAKRLGDRGREPQA